MTYFLILQCAKKSGTNNTPDSAVTITIEPGPNYRVGSPSSATLYPSNVVGAALADYYLNSVLKLEESVTEGDPNNLTADFLIKRGVLTRDESRLEINYRVDQGSGNFLPSGFSTTGVGSN